MGTDGGEAMPTSKGEKFKKTNSRRKLAGYGKTKRLELSTMNKLTRGLRE